jgi:hypothetical protein
MKEKQTTAQRWTSCSKAWTSTFKLKAQSLDSCWMRFKPKARNQTQNIIISSYSIARFITSKPLNIVHCLEYMIKKCKINIASIGKKCGSEWGSEIVKAVLRLESCLLQAKGLCSGSDIIFPSTLLRLVLRNKSEARPSVQQSEHTPLAPKKPPPHLFLDVYNREGILASSMDRELFLGLF